MIMDSIENTNATYDTGDESKYRGVVVEQGMEMDKSIKQSNSALGTKPRAFLIAFFFN